MSVGEITLSKQQQQQQQKNFPEKYIRKLKGAGSHTADLYLKKKKKKKKNRKLSALLLVASTGSKSTNSKKTTQYKSTVKALHDLADPM